MKEYERKIYSQNGEDGIIEHIFQKIGTTNKIAVEFGVSAADNGLEANTTYLAQQGWKTFWFDVEDATELPANCSFLKTLLTAENIVETFHSQGIPQEFDLLSIDVDSNDYHLRQALNWFRPRVYVIEYNGNYPAHLEYIMPYNTEYSWQLWETNFGASLKSLTIQADMLGYDLVYCDSKGVNAFFVRKDLNPFPSLTAEQAWVKLWWAK